MKNNLKHEKVQKWSAKNLGPQKISRVAENEKKRKYLEACLHQSQRRHFTPFVASIYSGVNEGLYGKEASFFMKYLAKYLADKWNY